MTRLAQKLTMLLLAHTLAALLDNRSHEDLPSLETNKDLADRNLTTFASL